MIHEHQLCNEQIEILTKANLSLQQAINDKEQKYLNKADMLLLWDLIKDEWIPHFSPELYDLVTKIAKIVEEIKKDDKAHNT